MIMSVKLVQRASFSRSYMKLLLDITRRTGALVTLIDETVPRKPASQRCRRFYLFLSITVLLGILHSILYRRKTYLESRLQSISCQNLLVEKESGKIPFVEDFEAITIIDGIYHRINTNGFHDKLTGWLLILNNFNQIKFCRTINYFKYVNGL